MATLPYNASTRTSAPSVTWAGKKPAVAQGTAFIPQTQGAKPVGSTPPTLKEAAPLQNYSTLINQQYDLSQGKIKNQQDEAQRSALENAQRGGAIRGTSGAGFETKIQQQAVNEASKPYQDLSTGLESERANALVGAGQSQDTLKEQQRQFDFSANLQKFVASNEMDINKFSTFINASTALKDAGFNQNTWDGLFNGGSAFESLVSQAGLPRPTTAVNIAYGLPGGK